MLTPSTVARSLASGIRSPGLASPSAMARRISAATCSKSGSELDGSILTSFIVLLSLAPSTRLNNRS